jgi:hypothetical protein
MYNAGHVEASVWGIYQRHWRARAVKSSGRPLRSPGRRRFLVLRLMLISCFALIFISYGDRAGNGRKGDAAGNGRKAVAVVETEIGHG